MKSRRQNNSEDRQTILRRHSRSSHLTDYVENSELIPVELIIEILSRLTSAKTIARCRCVSKLWASTLRLPYFTDLYFTKSSTRPKLLLALEKGSELFFFSTPQPQNPDEISSTATYHMKIPFKGGYSTVSKGGYSTVSSIGGLVIVTYEDILKGKKTPESVSVICNPSTRQALTLPKPKSRKRTGFRNYFGYDPVEKQFKVLSMNVRDKISREHQVMTIGISKEPSWRIIECCIPHCPQHDGICINGVLYYRASVNRFVVFSMIVCFDVRSEKFSFITVMEPSIVYHVIKVINYNGKLGLVTQVRCNYISGISHRSFEMWVLNDLEKQEWSKHIYDLPRRPYEREKKCLQIVGVTADTNEIVLSSGLPSDSVYLLYYSLERKTTRLVEIQGIGGLNKIFMQVDKFLDYVEDVKLI